jgi:Asp-tRNA(Asn)/Glu-tRNA(Gln) amidotransferase A subunit family amidase
MTTGKETAETENTGRDVPLNDVPLNIDAIRNAVVEDRITATALAGQFYDRIRKVDPEIGAYLTLCEERARSGR